ncbi:MAG: DUF4340 domain-containing protein [Planctomycetota bacterium]|nr:DUF4340 domain-containing protein [Planctomycetota bacterium]
MNRDNQELIKTLAFAGIAVVVAVAAYFVDRASLPAEMKEFAKVGQRFFPDFDDPTKVKGLKVSAISESGKPEEFIVEYKDDAWRITTHNDYPAEAAQRLARTARSVIGIERTAVVGHRENQWARFGVLDPTDPDLEDKTAAGSRVQLLDESGEPLVDYIIGKKVEGTGSEETPDDAVHRPVRQEGGSQTQYYVRAHGESETYRAYLNIDLSTKFADWIEPDLLKVKSNNIADLTIHNYSIEQKVEQVRNGPFIQEQTTPIKKVSEVSHLTKVDFTWKLDGVNEDTEELETQKVQDLVDKISGFKIVGIRKKPSKNGKPIINSDLALNQAAFEGLGQDEIRSLIVGVQRDLEKRGFFVDPDSSDPRRPNLMSDQGELVAATKEGVVYHVYFGKELFGSESEIAVGGASDVVEKKAEPKPDGKEKDADDEDAGVKKKDKNRFVFLKVSFDEQFVADKPEHPGAPPVEPTKPVSEPEPKKAETPAKADEKKSAPEVDPQPRQPAPVEPAPKKAAAKPDPKEKSKSVDNSECVQDDDDEKDEPKAAAKTEAKPTEAKKTEAPKVTSPAKPEVKKETPAPKKVDTAAKEETVDPKAPVEPKEGEKKSVEPPKKTPQEEYDEAMSQYRLDKSDYDQKLKEYEEKLVEYEKKVAEGQKKAAELSERFGEWYYVISSASFEGLKLARTDLVKAKVKKEDETKKPAFPGGFKLPEGLKLPDGPNFPKPKLPETKPSPKPEVKTEAKTDPNAEKPEAKPNSKSDPKKSTKPDVKPEPVPKTAAKTSPSPKAKPTEKTDAKTSAKPPAKSAKPAP